MSKDVLFRLEPYDWKLSSTVLRGARSLVTDLWAGNGPRLLDRSLREPQGWATSAVHGRRAAGSITGEAAPAVTLVS
jgi:hypothetical protein